MNKGRTAMKIKAHRIIVAVSLLTLLVTRAQTTENQWPREMNAGGRTVLMYQPQLDKLDGNMLHARAAVSVMPIGKDTPVFGAVWVEARIETDLTSRMVVLMEVRVPKVHFTGITPEQEKEFSDFLAREIPTWNLTLSQDRMLAMLDIAEKQSHASEGFDDQPPVILFADQPTVLVNIDGAPKFVPAENSDLETVINTPFTLLRKGKTLYLYAGAETWYAATSISGPWTVSGRVPDDVLKLQPAEEASDPGGPPVDETEQPPAILVATEPTELINIEGQPQHKPLPGNKLTTISNADSDLFMELASQRYFLLLSGRWYASKSLKGPWEFVTADQLPESFAEIPAGMDEGDVRTWVAGTEEANEAVLEASIPQTAAIRRDATIAVFYDGKPQFKKIKTTSLKYAENTASQVIQADHKFYCAEEGAWYVADTAEGPWITAIEIPDEIRSIPASNPMYNVKYLYIYGYNDEVVYFGYYPGYTSSYVYYGTVVYGTGWYYRPWYSSRYYYPHHCTWGYHMRWHHWYGWGSSCHYSYSRYSFHIGHHHHRGLWGPSGYRYGYRRGYRQGNNDARRDTPRNIYRNQGNADRVVQTAQRPGNTTSPKISDRKNNVFADKNGDVLRKNAQGKWEVNRDGQWAADKQPAEKARPATLPESRPAAQPAQRPIQDNRASLEREHQARDRGMQRSNNFQQHRPSPSRSFRGGRGGGGRR
jgi:hypothetical protein